MNTMLQGYHIGNLRIGNTSHYGLRKENLRSNVYF